MKIDLIRNIRKMGELLIELAEEYKDVEVCPKDRRVEEWLAEMYAYRCVDSAYSKDADRDHHFVGESCMICPLKSLYKGVPCKYVTSQMFIRAAEREIK